MEHWHNLLAFAALTPVPGGAGTPLGKYGAVVASLVSVLVVAAAIGLHVYAAISQTGVNDPFVDSAALLVIGVVLGASALGGQAAAAHEAAQAANLRLDKLGAPPATDGHVDA